MDDTTDRRTVLKMGGAAMLVSNSAIAATFDIVMMDARMLAAAIAAKKLSCVEVMTAYLDHIARFNPKVNAIVALQDRDHLLAQAREHDAMLAKGPPMGALHGLPHAVKDLQPVKGIVSTSGSPILKNFVPT
jgi:amidase